MSDFREICVDTRVHPHDVADAANRAGAKLVRAGQMGAAQHTAWSHTLRGHRIEIWLDDLGHENNGQPAAICTVQDFSDKGKTLTELHQWLGTEAAQNPFGLEVYDLDLSTGHPTLVRPDPMRNGEHLDKSARPYRISVTSYQDSTSIIMGGGYLRLGGQ